MGIYSNKFHSKDSLLDGFSYEDLITAVQSNETEVNERTVIKVFDEILQSQLTDARELLISNMDNIIKEV